MMGFNNIIGHEEIIGHLKNAIESGKISHSYIFTGEPGSGKKLLAGTFAATLQCEAEVQNPARNATPAKRRWVRIIRTLLWSVMRNLERSQLTRSEIR